jgi:curved DNA-binding protein CbpA
MTGNPFTVLGLPASTDLPASTELTDDDVRAAWRRVAAATHPDRADGGDPAAFADAAAAYTALRTEAGRAEALARVREQAGGSRTVDPSTGDPVPGRLHLPVHAFLASRIAQGRPWRLALRALAAAAASYLAVAAAGWQPASAAVMTGALTWLLRTGRADLGSRRPYSS